MLNTITSVPAAGRVVDPAFADGVAIVVGGSGGIGAEICLALARAGANVSLTYRANAAAAAGVADGVRALGVQAEVTPLDLADPAAVAGFACAAAERFGRVHSVVYAAGPALHMNFIHDVSPEEWARVVGADVNGAFHLVKATLPLLRAGGGGSYVAVITAAVERVPARDILSAAPKAAIEMLFRGVAKEEGRFGIRANCVGPGWIDAGLGRAVMETELTPEQIGQIKRSIPLRRIGRPGEVAEAALFLLSSRASFVTGQSLAVDGGMQL